MNFPLSWRVVVSFSLGFLAVPSAHLCAAAGVEARVTKTIHDVKVIGANKAHAASLNESIGEGVKLRTGSDARAELRFSDGKIVRLGANATFSFANGGRTFNLDEGAVFVHTPSGANAAQISSGEISAALSATTVIYEYHPTHYKFLVLGGTGRLFRPAHLGDSVLVNAGQMVFGQPKTALSDPVDFDIGRFVKTSRFLTDFAPLAGNGLMAGGSESQQREKSSKKLIDTNMVILGGGTAVSLVDPAQIEAIDHVAPPGRRSAPTSSDLGTVEALKPNSKSASTKTRKSN